MAIGQKTNLKFITDADGIKLTPRGLIETDPVTKATSREGVFAGGDVETGPYIAIAAVAAGREAAISIERYLTGQDLKAGREAPLRPIPKEEGKWSPDPGRHRKEAPGPDADPPRGRVDQGLQGNQPGLPAKKQAVEEAARCINCGICSECMQCALQLPGRAVAHDLGPEKLELNVGAVILAPGFQVYDPTKYEAYQLLQSSQRGDLPGVRAGAVGFRAVRRPPGAALGPRRAQEDRLAPVRGLPGPAPLRQQLLLRGLLHVRHQAGGHRQGALQRLHPGHHHLLHGHAHPRQGLREILLAGRRGARRALRPLPGAHHRPGAGHRQPGHPLSGGNR